MISSKQKGTTLIEAMVALLVLFIGSTAFISSINFSIRNFTASKINTTSTMIVQEMQQELKGIDINLLERRIDELSNDYRFTYNGERIDPSSSSPSDVYYEIEEIEQNDIVPGEISEITITLSWNSREAQKGLGYDAQASSQYKHRFLIVNGEAD